MVALAQAIAYAVVPHNIPDQYAKHVCSCSHLNDHTSHLFSDLHLALSEWWHLLCAQYLHMYIIMEWFDMYHS
jgi:hypothetical protein